MSNLIPGNQKHLTEQDRVFIETSLDKNMPFSEIAKYLCKDPSTISKEVKKHRIIREHNDFTSPNQCIHRRTCHLKNVCKRAVSCKKECRSCASCNRHCERFEKESCKTITRAPFVCNGCYKKAQCRMERYFYKAVTANRHYRTVLSESRTGLNISEPDKWLDSIVSPLIRQGQTPYMILRNHPEISCSVKTIYNYIESGAFSVKNIDLPRKVKYKLRKPQPSEVNNKGIFEGRTYKDFSNLLAEHPDTNVVEMDTVAGCEGSHKTFLTLYFRCCKLMLIYLMPDKTSPSVKKVLDSIEKALGSTLAFCTLFPVILTDRGGEFSDPDALETGLDGVIRTSIYYCDPMASGQKGGLEKNHEYIRYILPKGSSFDALTQWDAYRLASHINSTARASLNGINPLKLARLLLGEKALFAFRLREVDADNIILTPELLKK